MVQRISERPVYPTQSKLFTVYGVYGLTALDLHVLAWEAHRELIPEEAKVCSQRLATNKKSQVGALKTGRCSNAVTWVDRDFGPQQGDKHDLSFRCFEGSVNRVSYTSSRV